MTLACLPPSGWIEARIKGPVDLIHLQKATWFETLERFQAKHGPAEAVLDTASPLGKHDEAKG